MKQIHEQGISSMLINSISKVLDRRELSGILEIVNRYAACPPLNPEVFTALIQQSKKMFIVPSYSKTNKQNDKMIMHKMYFMNT